MIKQEIRDAFRLNVGDINGDKWTDTLVDRLMYNEATNLINQLEKQEITLPATTTTFGIASGGSTATLPTDFKRELLLERTDLTDPIRVPFGDERDKLYTKPNYISPIPVPYFRGQTIIFEKALDEAMSFTLTYIAGTISLEIFNTNFTTSTQLTIIPFQYHPMLAEIMAYKGLLSEGTDNRKIDHWKEIYEKHMNELVNTAGRTGNPGYGRYISD